MPVVKGTFYGLVHRTAFNLWRGPDYLQNAVKEDEEDEDPLLGGYCVLRLTIRKGETTNPMIESRAAYDLLIPDEPQDPILRGMYWDKQGIGLTTHSTPLDTPFKIAAKFVHIPLALLHGWLATLENIPTTIQTTYKEDDTLPICTLKVETDGVTSSFEKTWQVVEGENVELNRVWQEIWQRMGQALQTSPVVPDVEESFHRVEAKPDIYDLQSYQPSLDLP